MWGGRERKRETEREKDRDRKRERAHQYSLLKEALNSVKEATSSESTKTS